MDLPSLIAPASRIAPSHMRRTCGTMAKAFAWPVCPPAPAVSRISPSTPQPIALDRSEEHTSELQSLMRISYAVFCLKKKKHKTTTNNYHTQMTDKIATTQTKYQENIYYH